MITIKLQKTTLPFQLTSVPTKRLTAQTGSSSLSFKCTPLDCKLKASRLLPGCNYPSDRQHRLPLPFTSEALASSFTQFSHWFDTPEIPHNKTKLHHPGLSYCKHTHAHTYTHKTIPAAVCINLINSTVAE